MTETVLDLSVVIPVYNEPENILATVMALDEVLAGVDHEVIVCYDFEEDTTVPVVRGLMATYPSLTLALNRIARGPSGAIRTGFERSRGRRVLVLMADLSDDVSQIAELMELVPSKAAVASPSRYCEGGAALIESSLKTRATRTAGILLRWFTNIGTLDPTNSFKMYSGDLLRSLHLSSTVSFSVTLEVVAKAHFLGYPIAEIPTVWRDRTQGKSNFKVGRSLVTYLPWFFLALLNNRLFRVRSRRLREMISPARAIESISPQ